MIKNIFTLLLFASMLSCKPQAKTSTVVTETAPNKDWIYLFDGTSTEGWRGYNSETLPPNWVINNGELTFDTDRIVEGEYKGGKDIIYGAQEFENFELYLEWKIPPGGNSGIMYHVKEGYKAPSDVAPEYQLIDDKNYAQMHELTEYNTSLGYENPSQLHPLQSTAADYAMYPADDSKKKLNPAGQWNSSKIIFTPKKAEYWLNDQVVTSFVPWSDEWNTKKDAGKWGDQGDWGSFKSGYICLQDHDSPLWFRNIKIREL